MRTCKDFMQHFQVNADMTLKDGPLLTLSAVVSRQDWFFGAQTKFDLNANELKNTSLALGHQVF